MPSVKQLLLKALKIDSLEQVPFFYSIDHKIKQIKSNNIKKEIEARKDIDLFQYQNLYSPVQHYPYSAILENDFYGNARTLSKIFDINLYTRIEHGLYFGSIVPSRNLHLDTRSIITFSEYRKNFIKEKTDCPITCVGPYIYYSYPLFDKIYMQQIKRLLGKTLLVFPSHSISSAYAKFDIQKFISTIQNLQQDFDSVVICLYWQDIALGYAKPYESVGFLVTTAGHIADYYFLNRLKTIIQLADVSLSNNIGTHLGYCISLNTPHFILDSDVTYIAGQDKQAAKEELYIRNDEDIRSFLEAKNDILNNFSNFQYSISKNQIECINYYFGCPIKS